MKLAEVKNRAREMNIKAAGKNKTDIIRSIQAAEGNYPCFKMAEGHCDQYDCYWRDDCLSRK
jgi:hypothetical protein